MQDMKNGGVMFPNLPARERPCPADIAHVPPPGSKIGAVLSPGSWPWPRFGPGSTCMPRYLLISPSTDHIRDSCALVRPSAGLQRKYLYRRIPFSTLHS
jgi:hypothetical protein